MPLIAPTIRSQVSECSQHILTEGNFSGATVKVYQNGAIQIGQGVANSSQHWVAIDAGVALQQGDTITATQTLGPDTSPPTPEPKEVQGAPANPPAPIYKTHLYGCASCLWLGGMVSGATYTVIGQNQGTLADEVRANGTSSGGSSHVPLNQPLWNGERLKANEDACGIPSGFANSQPAEQYPLNKLPPPKVDGPFYKCDTNIYGSDCVEGFFVWMRREQNAVLIQEDDSCSLGGANFRATPILDEGEDVFMWLASKGKGDDEGDDRCPTRSDDSATETVLGLASVPPPHVIEPLCADGVVVTLSKLRPGAKVIITHDGVEYIGQATGTGQQDFFVDPLRSGKTVHAIMEICGVKTGESNEVTVKPQPAFLPPPVVQDPLFSCTDVVHVSNIHPGALVSVYSQSIGLIKSTYVYDDEADIEVTPGLMEGDQIYAVQKGCGLKSDDSNVVTVKKPEELLKPEVVTPLYDCGEHVKVKNVVPGAIVEVYVNGNFAGGAAVAEAEGSVNVSALLEKGDKVKARQRLCDLISDFSAEVTVEAFIGKWEGPYNTPVFAVHAALVYSRKKRKAQVLMFSGGAEHQYPLESQLWDPETNVFTNQTWNPPGVLDDLFCAHHSLLADGRLLVMGGAIWDVTGGNDHAKGIKATYIFEPETETWKKVGDMRFARWYPTAVTLSDGKVLVFSGQNESRNVVPQVEVFDPASGVEAWTTLPNSADESLAIYPSLHLVPAGQHVGKVFYSGTRWQGGDAGDAAWPAPPQSALFDLSSNNWSNVDSHVHTNRTEGMAVLLPPADSARILVVGGGQTAAGGMPKTAEIIGLKDQNPDWVTTPDMDFKRSNVNTVILPDGTVFVLGGHQDFKWDASLNEHILDCEIYHPDAGTGNWTQTVSMSKPRQYHSVALLLPDGRVLSAGGVAPPSPHEDQTTMEIFYPWYTCRIPRPEITSVPDDIFYGVDFMVGTLQAESIGKVVLIRPTAVTHHTNTDQRLIELEARPSGSIQLQVTAPSDGNLAPPGDYMLFILDKNSAPSVARFVRLQQGSSSSSTGPWKIILEFLRSIWDVIRKFFKRLFG